MAPDPDQVEEARRRRERQCHRERVAEFRRLGFDELVALDLADTDCSFSWVRVRLLERGATHVEAARVVLGASYRPAGAKVTLPPVRLNAS